MVSFSELSRAAYCPRQLYYARRHDDQEPPPEVSEKQALAGRYDELLTADDETLSGLPIDCDPAGYREALTALTRRADWEELCQPVATDYYVEGKDCHGVIHKLLAGDPPRSNGDLTGQATGNRRVGATDGPSGRRCQRACLGTRT